MKENIDEGVVTRKKKVDIYKCKRCGSEYFDKKSARKCYQRGTLLAHLRGVFVPGKFLIDKKEEIYPIVDIKFTSKGKFISKDDGGKCCVVDDALLIFVSSNDEFKASQMAEALSLRSISIGDAVLEHNWRASYYEVWERRATPNMKKDYIEALEIVLIKMAERRKEEILVMCIGFRG